MFYVNKMKRFTLLLLFTSFLVLTYFMLPRIRDRYLERFQESHDVTVKIHTNEYDIVSYQETSDKTKQEVLHWFQEEWGDTGVKYSDRFIETTWKYPSVLYVMTNKSGDFIGCAGLDHKYMMPFVSHIYVKKEYRKNGYGEKLFEAVLEHSKKLGYTYVQGWCEDSLVKHYEKMGCEKQSFSGVLKPILGFNLMKKTL
jgi:GNAT superfamily N-acetyltransferase